jgi:Uma2 family endonuclease
MNAPTLLPPEAASAAQDDSESLYEVVNGVRVEKPGTGIRSSLIASELLVRLGVFARDRDLGWVICEALFIFDRAKNLRRRPTLAFVSSQRWPLDRELSMTDDWEVIPDVAIEITGPNQQFEAVLSKVHEYFAHGVTQVWLVVPEVRQVYLYSTATQVRILTAGDTLEGGPLLPGFRLAVAELFTGGPPSPAAPP